MVLGEISPTRLSMPSSPGRGWALAAYGEITRVLTDALHEELRVRDDLLREKGPIDMDAARGFRVVSDIFSNPVCDRLEGISPSVMAGARFHRGARVSIIDIRAGKTRDNRNASFPRKHWYFTIGNEVVDPTAGQYIDLDWAITTYPDLFVGRVLVASPEAAQEKLGIVYTSTIRPHLRLVHA